MNCRRTASTEHLPEDQEQQQNLWRVLLIVALGLFVLESVLTSRRRGLMLSSEKPVSDLLQQVRRQFRLRAARQHAALAFALLCAGLLSLVWTWPWHGGLQRILACALVLVIPVGTFWWLQRRLRRLDDARLALFIEERHAELEDRLNSALEAGGTSASNDVILTALLDDAARRIQPILPTALLRRAGAHLRSATFVLMAVAFLAVGLTRLDRLQLSQEDVERTRVPYLSVSPGDVEIDQGDDVAIMATLRSGSRDDVTLIYQTADGPWIHEPMMPGRGGQDYLAELLDIQQPMQYYVQAGRYQTDAYSVSVYEFPEVRQIDVTYEYPPYANRPPYTEVGQGDIEALQGTNVTVNIQAGARAIAAALVLESGGELPLERVESGLFRGRFVLEAEDRYTVRLRDETERENRFPNEYLITPLEDAPPRIVLQEPGRDLRANTIQEVLIAANVSDDYGLMSFDLRYFVNGDEEQSVSLLSDKGAIEDTGEHLLFLEDYSLQPGDVITYYVEAADALRSEATDMYFIEVIPFEQNFTQLANAGGGQASMQRQSGLVISQQDIIAATWRLQRQRMDLDDFDEALEELIQAQRSVQANIEERLRTTAFSLELRDNQEQQKVTEHLSAAVEEMEQAAQELENGRLVEALTPERRALNQLLRADALNNNRQVARQQGQPGGQGGGSAEDRMTELMDLELDISRDKYETQRQRPAGEASSENNASLRRVQELARRQQDLARMRPPETEEDQRRFVDRLQREQEDLQETLESMQGQMLQSGQQDGLSRALRNMEQAQRALRRGNIDEAAARQQQAANELASLEDALRLQARGSDREVLESLAEAMDRLVANEEDLSSGLEGAGDRPQLEELQDLVSRRTDSQEALEEIIRQAEGLDDALSEAATAARNLAREVYRRALSEDMQNSRQALRNGWMDTARRIQDEINEDIQQLESARRALAEALPVTESEQLARSLQDVQSLQNELRELEAQAQRLRVDGSTPAQQARLESQMDRAQEMAREMMDNTGGMRSSQQAASGVQNALTRADHTGVLLDEDAADDFFSRSIYTPLSQLEVELRQQLEQLQLESRLFGSRRQEVPPEYQDMVEKYYESLSSRRSQ